MTGSVEFRNGDGVPAPLRANGQTGSSFNYSVAPKSSFKLTTEGEGASTSSGSVTLTPNAGSTTPVPLVVFSFKPGAFTVTQAGVPANSGTAFRMYAEASGGAAGISTGVAVANGSTGKADVRFELYTATGEPTGLSRSYSMTGSGQLAKFIEEIFPSLSLPFQGVLRISTTSAAISVVGLRGRYNERGDFLITTTPPASETTAAPSVEFDFPHMANGGGYTTQFVLFSGSSGQASSGSLQFFNQGGATLPLSVQSLITAAPSVTSVSPARVVVGATLTVTGSGFNSNAAANAVMFTGSSGVATATPFAATSTSLTVAVPAGAITGPVAVQTGGQQSNGKIVEVLATATTAQPPATVIVNANSTSGSADIYVPSAAGPLNIEMVGVGDAGTGFYLYGTGREISRGQTKQMILGGSGFNAGTGLSISVSGTGVTVGPIQYQNGYAIANITVAASAAAGARNIVAVNSNLDQSVFSGGLLIR
jgi:hypothetical protein